MIYTGGIKDRVTALSEAVNAVASIDLASETEIELMRQRARDMLADTSAGILELDAELLQDAPDNPSLVSSGRFAPDAVTSLVAYDASLTQMRDLLTIAELGGRALLNLSLARG